MLTNESQGGAAHLPGMLAGYTNIPVIGVPVVKSGEGMAALLSIVEMPPGVPVATVARNGSVNAALLAARNLARYDPEVNIKLKRWFQNMREKVLEDDRRFQAMSP